MADAQGRAPRAARRLQDRGHSREPGDDRPELCDPEKKPFAWHGRHLTHAAFVPDPCSGSRAGLPGSLHGRRWRTKRPNRSPGNPDRASILAKRSPGENVSAKRRRQKRSAVTHTPDLFAPGDGLARAAQAAPGSPGQPRAARLRPPTHGLGAKNVRRQRNPHQNGHRPANLVLTDRRWGWHPRLDPVPYRATTAQAFRKSGIRLACRTGAQQLPTQEPWLVWAKVLPSGGIHGYRTRHPTDAHPQA